MGYITLMSFGKKNWTISCNEKKDPTVLFELSKVHLEVKTVLYKTFDDFSRWKHSDSWIKQTLSQFFSGLSWYL